MRGNKADPRRLDEGVPLRKPEIGIHDIEVDERRPAAFCRPEREIQRELRFAAAGISDQDQDLFHAFPLRRPRHKAPPYETARHPRHTPRRTSGRIGKTGQQTVSTQPKGSGRLPHWMPVRVSYSFCVSGPMTSIRFSLLPPRK
jgi:hypothetical protein